MGSISGRAALTATLVMKILKLHITSPGARGVKLASAIYWWFWDENYADLIVWSARPPLFSCRHDWSPARQRQGFPPHLFWRCAKQCYRALSLQSAVFCAIHRMARVTSRRFLFASPNAPAWRWWIIFRRRNYRCDDSACRASDITRYCYHYNAHASLYQLATIGVILLILCRASF